MSFSWNAFSPVLLLIDAAIVAGTLICVYWRLRNLGSWAQGSPQGALGAILMGLLISIVPWALVSIAIGGVLGMCLLSRTLWMIATVAFPAGATLLWLHWRRNWLWFVAAGLLLFKYYGESFEPNRLEVEHIQVPLAGLHGALRAVHLSDLQTDGIGPMQLSAREAANAFNPDFVFFTGDILNHRSLRQEVQGYLKGFQSQHGAFFVSGNVDDREGLGTFMNNAGFQLLDGKSQIIKTGADKVAVLGLGLDQFRDTDLLRGLIAKTPGADSHILLCHLPDAMVIAQQMSVDLLLAGHTHGGQVCLPWFGPIITLSRVPRIIAAGGLHRVDKLWVLVSRGLGWEGHIAPRVRLFCRPHLILVDLVPMPR